MTTSRGYVLISVLVALFLLAAISVLLNRESAMGVNRVSAQALQAQAAYIAEAGMNHARWQANNAGCSNYALPVSPFAGGDYSVSYNPNAGSPVSIAVKGTIGGATASAQLTQHTPVYDGVNTRTIRADEGAGKDTYLSQWLSSRNYGVASTLEVAGDWGAYRRSLLQFDLSPLQGAHIFSAELQLHSNTTSWSSTTLNIHRMTTDWDEGTQNNANGEASWNAAKAGVNWTAAGGDFDPTVNASAQTPGTTGWVSWELTALVNDWVQGRYPNHGLLVRATELNKGAQFSSSDASDATLRPKLVVRYGCECGQTCGGPPAPVACDADYTPNIEIKNFSSSFSGSNNARSIVYLPEGVVFNGITVPAEGAWTTLDTTTARIYLFDMAGTLLSELPTGGNYNGHGYVAGGLFANNMVMNGAGSTLTYMSMDGSSQFSVNVNFVSQIKSIAYIGTTQTGSYDEKLIFLEPSQEVLHIINQTGTPVTSFSVNDSTSAGVVDAVHLPGTDKVMVSYTNHVSIYDLSGNLLRDYDLLLFGTTNAEGVSINPLTCEHVVLDDAPNLVRVLEEGVAVKKLLFVYAGLAGPTAEEQQRIDKITGWGYVVNTIYESTNSGTFDTALANSAVVYVPSSVTELNLSKRLDATSVPIVFETPSLADNFGLSSTFYDSTAHTSMDIVDNTHTITEIWPTGVLAIFNGSTLRPALTGTLAPDLAVLGINGYGEPMLATLDEGATTYTGDPSLGKRVKLPWGGSGFTPDAFNAEGWTIMERSLTWATQASGGGGGGGPSGPGECAAGGTFLDQFVDRVFNGSNGTLDWSASPWSEVGESDGPTSGDILVGNDNNDLRLQTRDSDNGGEGVEREVDLSGGASATLSYLYRRSALDNADDYTVVEISANGAAGPWVELARHEGPGEDASYLSASHDISSHIGANTRIRFITGPNMGKQDVVWFDDIEIACAP